MPHVIYVEGGEVRQCSKTSSAPDGVDYWIAEPGEVPANRDNRDEWEWVTARPADGTGG